MRISLSVDRGAWLHRHVHQPPGQYDMTHTFRIHLFHAASTYSPTIANTRSQLALDGKSSPEQAHSYKY